MQSKQNNQQRRRQQKGKPPIRPPRQPGVQKMKRGFNADGVRVYQPGTRKPAGGDQERKKQVAEKKGRLLAAAVGNRGIAPIKDDREGQNNLAVEPTANTTVGMNVQVQERSLYFAALGVILKAIERGVTYPSVNLYQAYLFLADLLIKAVTNSQIDAVELPNFMWETIAALGPKTVPFKTGYINYSCSLVAPSDQSYKTKVITYNKQGLSEFKICLGQLISGDVNGFSPLDQTAEVANPIVGAQSLSAIWTALGIKRMWTLQEYKPQLKQDTSCFAAVISQYGSVYDGVGGIRTAVSGEVFTPCPILSKFCKETAGTPQVGQQLRGFWEYRASGAGPLYLLSRATEFGAKMGMFRNKPAPIVKHYDFFNLFNRFSLWLCKLQELAAEDTTFANPKPYPNTAQQTALMLRWAAMKVFNNARCQDVDQLTAFDETQILTPWSTGQQTTSKTGVEPKFPAFLAENIRSIRRLVVASRYGDLDTIPCLAGIGDYLSAQYTWGDLLTPLYAMAGASTIRLEDGTVTSGPDTFYINMDGEEMGVIISNHNNWVTSYASYSSPLCNVGSEPGSTIFMPNYQTLHVQAVIQEVQQVTVTTIPDTKGGTSIVQTKIINRVPSRKQLKIGERAKRTVGIPLPQPATLVEAQGKNAVTSMTLVLAPFSAAWKYQQILWCPTRISNHSAQATDTNLDWYRANVAESTVIQAQAQQSQLLVEGTNLNYTTVYDRDLAAALIDTKQKNGKSEWEVDFDDLAKQGEGGWLAKLAHAFGTAVGIPSIGDVADEIGL